MGASSVGEVSALLRSVTSDNSCAVAAFTVYLFDRCLGMGQEVDAIWRRRVSLVSVLYILLHAITILQLILRCFEDFAILDCNMAFRVNIFVIIMEILYIVTVEVISILRVYALNPRDRLSPLAVVVLTLLAATYDTFTAVKSETIDGPLGCVVVPESPLYRPLFFASMAAITAADAIVVIATWRSTYHTIRLAHREHISASLTYFVWRDGTTYFGLLFIINTLSVVSYATNVTLGVCYLATALSSIILSRFFLNLVRKAKHADTNGSSGLATHMQSRSTLYFSTCIFMLAGSVSLIAEANGDVKSGDDGGKEAESDDEHEDLTEEEDGGHWQAHRHSGIYLGSTL